jgi:NADPH:quinone reductase-like Zn-dependent oxidoreductase
MKAVGIMKHGGPEALEVLEVPDINVGPGQIRIRNFAASVNPVDVSVRNGSMAQMQKVNPPPYIPGMDAAGIIDQIGEDVKTDLKVGDSVMAMVVPNGDHGAYKENIVLDQNAVVKAPKNTTHIQASTLPMNSLTARLSLDLLDLSKGQVLAVTGSPGAYGGFVVQLAKADGLTVIADANDSDRSLLESLGVDIIIPRGDGFGERIRQEFPDGVDGIADGALLNDAAIEAVKDGGSFTSVRGFKGEPQRDIDFTATWVTAYDCKKDKLETLCEQTESGVLTLRVADSVKMENAAEAHKKLEAGGTRGRMIIEF